MKYIGHYLQITVTICVVCIDTRCYVTSKHKDNPFKIKSIQPNNAAKRPCPDTSASIESDTTSDGTQSHVKNNCA